MEFPRLAGATLALDLETKDPLLDSLGAGWAFAPHLLSPHQRGHVAGYAIAYRDGRELKSAYYPVGHDTPGNLPRKAVERWLADVLKDPATTVVFHNRVYDHGWLRRSDVPLRCKVHDTMVMGPLLDDLSWHQDLDSLGHKYLKRGKTTKDTLAAFAKQQLDLGRAEANARRLKNEERKQFLKPYTYHPKSDLWRMPPGVVRPYAVPDAELTFLLAETLLPLLAETDHHGRSLQEVYALEMALQPMLIEMRWRGVRVDVDHTERTITRYAREEVKAQNLLNKLAGRHVDVWANDSLQAVFDQFKIPYGRTPTGKASFKKEFLADLEHPIGKAVRAVRKYNKTRTTFLEGYFRNNVGGRVHGTIHQLKTDEGGAVSGRFSMANPNLENLPSRDLAVKEDVRSCLLPEEGQHWAALDWSQQEPRLTVHYAYLAGVRGAAEARQRYIDNPDMDYHKFMSELTGIVRELVKPINLGIGYGMGGAKLCRSLGLPTKWVELPDRDNPGKTVMVEVAGEEGQAILDKYHDNAPFVKALTKECQRRAKEVGYIVTLAGRRRRFPKWVKWHYKAMNALIQGSAADQLKIVMRELWARGELPLVPVHDELGCSVDDLAHAKRIALVMKDTVQLEVPGKVDVELGPSWGAAKLPDALAA